MSIIFQTLIYIFVFFGFLIITISFFNREFYSYCNKDKYIRGKHKDVNIKLTMETVGISEYEKNKIEDIISRGEFQNIYDVIDEFEIK